VRDRDDEDDCCCPSLRWAQRSRRSPGRVDTGVGSLLEQTDERAGELIEIAAEIDGLQHRATVALDNP
jgi:hypothetical protein